MADTKVKKDPTITGTSAGPAYPEGTHPPRDPGEVTHSADRFEYRDLPADRKPSPSTIAQEQVLPDEG